jgi:multidrug efflux system outer membrane protein
MNRTTSKLRTALLPLLAALVLAGCATSASVDPASIPAAPAAYKENAAAVATTATAPQSQGTWWKVFSDPVLDQLVEQAGNNNNSVKVAAGRLAQARAILRNTDADRLPQVGLSGGAVRQSNTTTNRVAQTTVTAAANFSYEVDLIGKLSLNSDAASLDAKSREALLRSTQLLVQADVAQTYLNLRSLDTERTLVRDTLQAYRNTLRLTEVRFKEGDVAELDVARVRTEVAATESEALALDRRRAELEHALAVLVHRMVDRAAGHPGRCAQHGAGAPPRRVSRAKQHAGRAGTRGRGQGRLVSNVFADGQRRLCGARDQGPVQGV